MIESHIALGCGAIAAALMSGAFFGTAFWSCRQEAIYRKSLTSNRPDRRGTDALGGKGFNARLIDHMMALSKRIKMRKLNSDDEHASKRLNEVEDCIRLAGLQGKLLPQAVKETRKQMLFIGAAIGFLAGVVFSMELALVLAAVGAFVGMQMPKHVLKIRMSRRAQETERHLPEMLDVIALCMHSGLSLDSSISIYAKHFDTILAEEMEAARRKWSSGLERRDEALKKLASTYDSVVLGRVIDTVIRSVRYGSSMVSSLESDAKEARNMYRTSREERIAKAPVKMMIPTGVLILPAMLVMVLGPVLLELMGGGM